MRLFGLFSIQTYFAKRPEKYRLGFFMMIGKQHKLKKRSPHTQKLIKISVITLGSYNSILRLPTCVSTSKTNQSLEEKKNLEMFQQQSKCCNNSQGPLRNNILEIDVTQLLYKYNDHQR